MYQPLPHRYEAVLEWAGPSVPVLGAGARTLIPVGPPPEFGGDATLWSPEHLLLSALNACLMTTFASIVEVQGLQLKVYESVARCSLTKTSEGVGFTAFELSVTIVGDRENEERLRGALARAKQRCFVANALRAPVQVNLTFSAHATPDAGNRVDDAWVSQPGRGEARR